MSNSSVQNPFTEITRREHAITLADIKSHGWKPALTASQQRQDAIANLIVSSVSGGIACQAGCWYCCYFKVDVHAEEVFQIVDYVRAKFSPARVARLQQELAANTTTLQALSTHGRLTANLKCAFLDNGQCSIYEVRPARCKTFHAKDVEGCKKSYEDPNDLSIPSSFIPELSHAGEAHLKGFRQALADAGYDTNAYELNAAMALALADSTPKRRFEKHKKAFVGLTSNK
ncbi:MAG: YkgJ family cysteine cluster protein [Pseudohongiella sp.]|nr:YkgJ family cysteine cluster protein [Pseudohongiella sp.]